MDAAAIRNEQRKLLATALNNLGVASVVTGGFAPAVAYFLGSVQEDDPLRLASFIVIWISGGIAFILLARRELGNLD